MASRRFTLAGLLLWITLIGLLLAFVVPLLRYWQRARGLGDLVTAIAISADGSTAASLTGDAICGVALRRAARCRGLCLIGFRYTSKRPTLMAARLRR